MTRVLLVEDDLDLSATVIDYLEFENMICDHAANGIEGLSLISNNPYHVILLDINMPFMDGLTMCAKVREKGFDIPILMLTAKDTLDDKLKGFGAGTDDYLVKPFELEELLVRVMALSKRRSGQATSLNLGPIELNLANKSGFVNQQALKLTPITIKLLEALMRASPNPVAHQALLQAAWKDDMPDSNSLRVHIYNLRKALDNFGVGSIIKTVPGFGFCAKLD